MKTIVFILLFVACGEPEKVPVNDAGQEIDSGCPDPSCSHQCSPLTGGCPDAGEKD